VLFLSPRLEIAKRYQTSSINLLKDEFIPILRWIIKRKWYLYAIYRVYNYGVARHIFRFRISIFDTFVVII